MIVPTCKSEEMAKKWGRIQKRKNRVRHDYYNHLAEMVSDPISSYLFAVQGVYVCGPLTCTSSPFGSCFWRFFLSSSRIRFPRDSRDSSSVRFPMCLCSVAVRVDRSHLCPCNRYCQDRHGIRGRWARYTR